MLVSENVFNLLKVSLGSDLLLLLVPKATLRISVVNVNDDIRIQGIKLTV